MSKKLENMWFCGAPLGEGFEAVLGRVLDGRWGVCGSCMFHSKKFYNFLFFRAAEAADPQEQSELAAERPTSASAASCGRETATRTSATIRNVLSTVYAPRRTERLPTTPVKSGENFLGLSILFRPQGRGLLIYLNIFNTTKLINSY